MSVILRFIRCPSGYNIGSFGIAFVHTYPIHLHFEWKRSLGDSACPAAATSHVQNDVKRFIEWPLTGFGGIDTRIAKCKLAIQCKIESVRVPFNTIYIKGIFVESRCQRWGRVFDSLCI